MFSLIGFELTVLQNVCQKRFATRFLTYPQEAKAFFGLF